MFDGKLFGSESKANPVTDRELVRIMRLGVRD